MPIYNHYQEAKQRQDLPMAQKIGACISCSYWQVESPRPQEEIKLVGLCVQPILKDFALIVSGSSACNHWAKEEGAGKPAEEYSLQGTVDA